MNFKQYSAVCLSILLLAAIFACNNHDSGKFVGTALDPLTDPAKVDTTKYNAEYLLYSTVKINNVLPLESKFADFIKVIGKPDSVVNFKPDTECQFYEEPYQNIYFQGSMFFLVNDSARIGNIDFRRRPNLELTSPAITLNGKTTLDDIRRLFPKAVSKIRKIDSPGFNNLRMIDIGASKAYADEWWILGFEGDKLVSVALYSSC
jgi:hypothetical protein